MTPPFHVGITAGFGHPLAHEFAGIAEHAFTVIRQDVYAQDSLDLAAALIQEFAGAPVRPLFLIGGGVIQHPDGSIVTPDELVAWTTHCVQTAKAAGVTDYSIEIGNEPDIANEGYSEHAEDFADTVRLCYEAARAHGFEGPFMSGGVSNLNPRGFRYLTRMLGCGRLPPDDIVIGFHRYPEGGRGPIAPHKWWFTSRQDEWDTFMHLTNGRPVACTEFGYMTATAEPITLTDETQADSVMWDLNFYQERGVPMAVVYQLSDGPTDQWFDRYGVRAYDGTWKIVAERIRDTYGSQ